MTVLSFFHNSVNGDRTYEADDFAKHTNAIIGDGVIEGLQVTYTSAYAYTINTGKAVVMGRSVINDAVIATAIGSPANGAVYSVIVRMDLAARQATIETITGTTYQDDNAIKEIPLATILVGTNVLTITDKRVFAPLKSGKLALKNSEVRYTRDIDNVDMAIMTFKEGSNNSGIGVAIGGNGTTIIGGGESPIDILKSPGLVPDTITERLLLTSDNEVTILVDMQDVYTDAKTGKRFVFADNGDFWIGANNIDNNTGVLRYSPATKLLEILHWNGTATSNDTTLGVKDIDFRNTWAAVPLASGITEYSAGNTPEYTVKGNVVYIIGAVKGITAIGTTIATLPAGIRPTRASHSWAMPTSGKNFARWTIGTNGAIVLENVSQTVPPAAADWFPIATSFNID